MRCYVAIRSFQAGVLKDVLARIPADDEIQVQEDLADLKRMCCSTAYMFMYSQVIGYVARPHSEGGTDACLIGCVCMCVFSFVAHLRGLRAHDVRCSPCFASYFVDRSSS